QTSGRKCRASLPAKIFAVRTGRAFTIYTWVSIEKPKEIQVATHPEASLEQEAREKAEEVEAAGREQPSEL
ncbi:MAG: hypothetical protein JXR83_12595, partial [Deltaproteobacteria bacterium]|nr:hypothetical protein [Deltaproteobacteria bacterium]